MPPVFEKTREPRDELEPELGLFRDAPSIAPDLPYTFENGTPYIPPAKPAEPYIPDRGFDGPA
jgi:hypothetical protein